jgi:DNA-binding PadR family transcriptional regulator
MEQSQRDPQDFLPLTPAVFNILLALADGEKHGYGIMLEIAAHTGGKLRLGPGTLYGSIKRLLEDGLIEESAERPDPAHDDERRRYYRLTEYGQRVAAAEATHLEELVRLAHSRRLLPGPFIIPGTERGVSS